MSASFEITVLGASGGPWDGTTQCFMIHPTSSAIDISSVCVDGGVGVSSILQILSKSNHPERQNEIESYYESEFEPISKYVDDRMPFRVGFSKKIMDQLELGRNSKSQIYSLSTMATRVFQGIEEYYFTHPHMDHINGFIINSPMIYDPEYNASKNLYGLSFTMEALKKHIFNDIAWPNLLNDGTDMIKANNLKNGVRHISKLFPQWKIIPFKVSHGIGATKAKEKIYSTVYVIVDNITNDCIVVGGDVERDPADGSKIYLDKVWQYLAYKIPLGHLKGIFIECSSPNSLKDEQLYGHMSPKHLVEELDRLLELYSTIPDRTRDLSKQPLKILITHVKMITSLRDPRLIILDELRDMSKETKLEDKVIFSMAVPGYTFSL
ncbi:hypothetical protein NCAS_0E00230 [Naumovozyma castellii]|uniref:3',5'-cyclic-nucleotide phosphodiesterase n=1 Tax=Naumovozyma castellii TaxID=27288 RepID=G0VF28_NAUCA|nr:hypothetical protein NCAS_0E00230 [Naumovozyma castellii CBS 4309]CCC70093.1 hypothetical protein NCAS_0E00230 [Naumovozyma castellii CBS 4309]